MEQLDQDRFDRYLDNHHGESDDVYQEPTQSLYETTLRKWNPIRISTQPQEIPRKENIEEPLPKIQHEPAKLVLRRQLLSQTTFVPRKKPREINLKTEKQDFRQNQKKIEQIENANMIVDTMGSTESSEKMCVQELKSENQDVNMNFQINIHPEKQCQPIIKSHHIHRIEEQKQNHNNNQTQKMTQQLSKQQPGERTHYKSLIRHAPQKSNLENDAQQLILKSAMTKVWFNYAELTSYILAQIVCFGLVATVCLAIWSDLAKKHQTEIKLYQLQISECRFDYQQNRCNEPVPQTRDFCLEKEKCLMNDPGTLVKNVNIFGRLIVEAVNDFAMQITNRALFVIGAIVFAGVSATRLSYK